MAYISGLLTSDFGQFSMVKIFVIGRFSSSVDGSWLIFYYRCFTTIRPAGSAVIPWVHASGTGLEVSIMDTIHFVLHLED